MNRRATPEADLQRAVVQALRFTLWQQHMRGALSQLPMASGPWIWRPVEEPEGRRR